MLLSMWMGHCPAAVKIFLNVPGAMAFLTAQTSATEFDSNAELLQGKFLCGWEKNNLLFKRFQDCVLLLWDFAFFLTTIPYKTIRKKTCHN